MLHYYCILGQVRLVCPGCLHTEQECLTGNSVGYSVLCGGSDAGLLWVGLEQVRSLPKVDAQKGLIFS